MKLKHTGNMSRAEVAGCELGRSIVEMINLMYNDNTALNFLKGVKACIDTNFEYRKNPKLVKYIKKIKKVKV